MPGVTFLEGDQVTLRTVEREDAPLLQRAYNEPEFQQGFLIKTPKNQQMIEDCFEETIEGDEDSLFLLICIDEDVAGGISLRDMRQSHGMLTYWLLPDQRRQGYVTEAAALLVDHAFKTLGLHRVIAWIIDHNDASRKVLTRLGFTYEGAYREHVFVNGAYHDTDHYGILVSEWDGAERVLSESQ